MIFDHVCTAYYAVKSSLPLASAAAVLGCGGSKVSCSLLRTGVLIHDSNTLADMTTAATAACTSVVVMLILAQRTGIEFWKVAEEVMEAWKSTQEAQTDTERVNSWLSDDLDGTGQQAGDGRQMHTSSKVQACKKRKQDERRVKRMFTLCTRQHKAVHSLAYA
jgi:hypothetical protein